MRFPKLFDASPAQSTDRAASKAEAAREITAKIGSKPEPAAHDLNSPTKNNSNEDYQERGIVVKQYISLPCGLY
jgi:hypothetical protein